MRQVTIVDMKQRKDILVDMTEEAYNVYATKKDWWAELVKAPYSERPYLCTSEEHDQIMARMLCR